MERPEEQVIDKTELRDEELDAVAGGRYYFQGFIHYPATTTTNAQTWVISAT